MDRIGFIIGMALMALFIVAASYYNLKYQVCSVVTSSGTCVKESEIEYD